MKDNEFYQERRKKVNRFIIDVSSQNCKPLAKDLIYKIGDVFVLIDDMPFEDESFKVIDIQINEYFNYEFVFVELLKKIK